MTSRMACSAARSASVTGEPSPFAEAVKPDFRKRFTVSAAPASAT